MPAGTTAHRAAAAAYDPLRCAVITVSDSRTADTDVSGPRARTLLAEAGHEIIMHTLVPNDPAMVETLTRALIARDDLDVILLTGGTGLSARDQTVDVVRPLLTKELPGFGELFRWLSFQEQIGPAAMLSRAVAGGAGRCLIVVVPGAVAAVELALTRLLLPELGHLMHELRR